VDATQPIYKTGYDIHAAFFASQQQQPMNRRKKDRPEQIKTETDNNASFGFKNNNFTDAAFFLAPKLSFAALKDYYAILEVSPTATVPEIKQAYRKLVMVYHPDKNNEDLYALSRFNEIKEAYEVLMNPGKKELYLQERWLKKAGGQKIGEELITAPGILKKSLELNKQVAAMDAYRMNYAGMAARITDLINDHVIEQLIVQNETDVQSSIIRTLLNTTKPFPYKDTHEVCKQLRKLAKQQPQLLHQIEQSLQQKKKRERWSKFNGLFIFLLTILLCLLIYFMGK
jgi:predicted ester cyclase